MFREVDGSCHDKNLVEARLDDGLERPSDDRPATKICEQLVFTAIESRAGTGSKQNSSDGHPSNVPGSSWGKGQKEPRR